MNTIFKFLVLFLLTFFTNTAFTQSVKKDFFKGSTGVTSLRLNAGTLAFISNDNDRAVEITGTDNEFNNKWSARLDGYFHDAALVGNNLLVLVSTEFNFMLRYNSTFKGYLLDPAGKVIKEKILFAGNNDYHTELYFMPSKDHNSYSLGIRETSVKRNVKIAPGTIGALYMIKKMSDEFNKVKSFHVITVNPDLEQTESISPDLPDGEFVGVQRTINKDLYTAVSENKKGVTISRYMPGKETAVETVFEPYSYYGGLLGIGYLSDCVKFMADTINNNTVYISGAFKNGDNFSIIFNKYDFAAKQHKRFKKTYTREELKELEKSYQPLNRDFKKLTIAIPKELELIDAVIGKDNYSLIISDFVYHVRQAGEVRPSTTMSHGIIVYNLDKDLGIKTISTIPRDHEGLVGASTKTYQNDNSLYVMSGHGWNAKFLVGKINTLTGKVEAIRVIEPEKTGMSDHAALDMAVISEKKIILPVFDFKTSFTKIKFDINMYHLNW
jgi:hypothetical protein